MRVNLVWIISDYRSRGNGSVEKYKSLWKEDLEEEDDDDDDDDDEEEEVKYGHFDLDLAKRQGGDDRKKFLDKIGFDSDVLYWWQYLFDIGMLQATCGIMNRELGASSIGKLNSIAYLDRKKKARRQRKRSHSEL
jgi:hypothetical protein